MENTESGHSLTEAATAIAGLLDSDEDTPEAPSEDAADDSDEENEGLDLDSDEGAEDSGDESDQDEGEDSEDTEEPSPLDDSTEVEIDGEVVTLAELKKERLRLKDYTRKTMALAEERKAFQAEAAATREHRDKYATGLEQLAQALEQIKPAEPDWDTLRKENPAEFAAQWAEHQRLRETEAKVTAERQRIAMEQQREQQEALGSFLDEQKKLLQDAIPEWQDESKAKAEKEQLIEFARGMGFSDEDLGNVVDHRLVLLLRKAAKYDEIATKGADTIREKKKVAKVMKPGGRDNSPRKGQRAEVQAAQDRLKRSGKASDAAALIAHMID